MTEKPNIDYIRSIAGGLPEFEKKLIRIIKSEFPIERTSYNIHIAESQLKLAAEDVHKLKHKISILGLKESYEIAVQFESNLLEGHSEGQIEFEEIMQIVAQYINTL